MHNKQVIYQGAEAKLILSTYLDKKVIKKIRVKKKYRIQDIDEMLISSRTKEEAKLIHLARNQGVYVPFIYDVDLKQGIITMEYVAGTMVKDFFDDLSDEKRKKLCIQIGKSIARLHNKDIIHGDITTSNMIYADKKVYFIDFGLGEINTELEAKGVDLHVLMETMESTHSVNAKSFGFVLEGYSSECKEDIKHIKRKIDDIILRGRYR